MTKNIILAGVGGQGILTIAGIIDIAAMKQNLVVKQAEVHGMSQRGGAVQSHLRLSDKPVYSDLIPLRTADLIISLEPMEALRYLPYLSETGTIISATKAFKNISNYPEEQSIMNEHKKKRERSILIDVEDIAKRAGNTRSANVVMIGAAHSFIGIERSVFEESIREIFERKGAEVVEQNIRAFNMGAEVSN